MRFDVLLDRHYISLLLRGNRSFFVTTLPRGFLLPSFFLLLFLWEKNEQKIPFVKKQSKITSSVSRQKKEQRVSLVSLVSLSPVLEKASSSSSSSSSSRFF